jgi:hypothetical protein
MVGDFFFDGNANRQRSPKGYLAIQSRLGYNLPVGSIKFADVRFVVHSNDHLPRHVHGFHGETEIIVDLGVDGSVALAKRKDAMQPKNAKRSDVKKILDSAALNFNALVILWRTIHG